MLDARYLYRGRFLDIPPNAKSNTKAKKALINCEEQKFCAEMEVSFHSSFQMLVTTRAVVT
jgi:hypothetical protein